MGVFLPNRMVSTRSDHDVFAPNESNNPTFRWLQLAVLKKRQVIRPAFGDGWGANFAWIVVMRDSGTKIASAQFI